MFDYIHKPFGVLLSVVVILFLSLLVLLIFISPTPPPNPVNAKKKAILKYYEGLPVLGESRWNISFLDEQSRNVSVSKLFLGTATITLDDLEKEWPRWSKSQRGDFCMAITGAPTNQLPELLRFAMKNARPHLLNSLALSIVENLPAKESLPFIKRQCQISDTDKCINFFQALALSGDEDAIPIIKTRLEKLLKLSKANDKPLNVEISMVAYFTLSCVEYLLELGLSPEELQASLNFLRSHPDPRIQAELKELMADRGGADWGHPVGSKKSSVGAIGD